jgi:hypothetical protein
MGPRSDWAGHRVGVARDRCGGGTSGPRHSTPHTAWPAGAKPHECKSCLIGCSIHSIHAAGRKKLIGRLHS